jgi:dipeptidyl aminopeptidase/acylaminoacyl peptidase
MMDATLPEPTVTIAPTPAAARQDGPPRARRRLLLRVGIVVVLLGLIAYGAASVVVYDRLSRIEKVCSGGRSDPTAFEVEGVDTTPYLLPAPTDVQFPARDDADVTIAASWYPAPGGLDAPTVIHVHGFGGCRLGPTDLLTAGMLYRNGIAVLSIDLRDHGDSTKEDMRFAGGTEEFRDVLGAWDWLRDQGVPQSRIGIVGFSLGAATTMIAMGQEQRIAAIWADSSYGDIGTALRDELTRNGYPTILQPGGVLAGRLISGDDLEAHSPMETTALLNGRPIFLTHGLLDQRISVKAIYELAESVALHGQVPEVWVVPDAHHTEALRIHAAEYEHRMAEFFLAALG